MRRFIIVVAVFALAGLPGTLSSSPAQAAGWTNFQLGDGPAETCPNANPNPPACTNTQGEPQIRADRAGNFYGASENGVGTGTEAWRSTDAGRHYTHLLSPNELSTVISGAPPAAVGPGGGDVDVATAPQRNAAGNYNVYVVSLSGADITVSTSTDRGTSWQVHPASSFPGNDREWIAADGSNKVCISYIEAAGVKLFPAGIRVDCSYDAGNTFLQKSDAIDANHVAARAGFAHGNLAIDPHNHFIYQIFSSQFLNDATNPSPTGNHIVYMAVSTDGGNTFTDYTVYANPTITADYGHQFPNVSVDRAGNVYAVYSDNHNTYYSFSRDHGRTWSGPYQINTGTDSQKTAIFPWSVAGNAGKLDVVFYGSDYYDGTTPPDSYPCNDTNHCGGTGTGPTAQWNVIFAENLNALAAGSGWSTQQVTSVPVHFGGVCEGGVACTGTKKANRDLYDDFGIAVSPTTNAASIIYDSDRYQEYGHTSRCVTTDDNNGPCTHTNIATGSSGIFTTAGAGTGGGTGGSIGDGGCDRSPQSDKAETDLLASINQHRLAAGLPAVTMDTTSSDQAREHSCSNAQNNQNGDQEPDGSTHSSRMTAMGVPFSLSGENTTSATAPVSSSAGSLLDGSLMADPRASATILDARFTTVGIGAVYDGNGVMWVTEDFSG